MAHKPAYHPDMLVSIQGSVCQWCQIPALREGFAALGHEHTDDWQHPDVAFVFVGNGPYDQYLEAARTRSKKLIFNVLDIATQNPNAQQYIDEYKAALPLAARVTSISAFTQWQLRYHCGVESEVIYYPMKPVFATNVKKYPEIKVLICGRVNDSNKRVASAVSALIRAGYDETEVAIVGPENPRWGRYYGVVSDEVLNDLYNSVDYVMMLSRVEGIGLVAPEGACCGAIPIVAPDLSTFNEFWAGSPMGLYYSTFTSLDNIATFMRDLNARPEDKATMKAAMLHYADLLIRPKLDRVAVARRILAVAETI